jgi:hypothetical protein
MLYVCLALTIMARFVMIWKGAPVRARQSEMFAWGLGVWGAVYAALFATVVLDARLGLGAVLLWETARALGNAYSASRDSNIFRPRFLPTAYVMSALGFALYAANVLLPPQTLFLASRHMLLAAYLLMVPLTVALFRLSHDGKKIVQPRQAVHSQWELASLVPLMILIVVNYLTQA